MFVSMPTTMNTKPLVSRLSSKALTLQVRSRASKDTRSKNRYIAHSVDIFVKISSRVFIS